MLIYRTARFIAVWPLRSLMATFTVLWLALCFELLPDQRFARRLLFDKWYFELHIDDRKVFAAVAYGWPSTNGYVPEYINFIMCGAGRGQTSYQRYFVFRQGQLPPWRPETSPDYVFWRPSWGYGTGRDGSS